MSKHVKGQISLYIDGMLKDAELKAFETHVKTCGECARILADTKRTVSKAKKVREVQLPVNFYAKLNQKLDAADAEKGVFNWLVFMRSAVVVCTMLIVGVFVYNIKNQTNNFSDVRMKQDSQMPKEQALETQANAVPAAASKPVGEEQGDYVMQQKIPDEVQKQAKMKKAASLEGTAAKDKLVMDVDMKKVTDGVGYVQEAAPVVKKAEAMKVTEEKAFLMKTRSAQAPAPAAKMKMMETSAGSGGMASMAAADEAAPQPLEEAELKSMEAVAAADLAGTYNTAPSGQVISVIKSASSKCSEKLKREQINSYQKIGSYYSQNEKLQAVVSGNEITVYHDGVVAHCGNPEAVYDATINRENIVIHEKYNYINQVLGLTQCACVYNFSVTIKVSGPGKYNITVISDDNGYMSKHICEAEVK